MEPFIQKDYLKLPKTLVHHSNEIKLKNNFNYLNKVNLISTPNKSDFVIDSYEKIDVENDSISLALSILGLSRSDYNSLSIDELKYKRNIDCNNIDIWSLNILIYYKKNSRLFLPELCSNKNILNNISNNTHKIFSNDCDF